MGLKGLSAGLVATIIALLFASTVGGLGMWAAVAATAKTVTGGWLALLVIGAGLGYLYSFVALDKLFGKEALVKGAAYGVAIWILTLIAASIFPYLGEATFAPPLRASLFLQLLSHVVWGASLGLLYEQK